jgi:hypothetical protein
MGIAFRSRGSAACVAGASLALAMCACGGKTGPVPATPIFVSLAISKVVVMRQGMPVIVDINIDSTSETALVSLTGLPAGVQEKYSASDTNPSGILTFTAGAETTLGTYMPVITVNSAEQTASTSFTLIVESTAGKS